MKRSTYIFALTALSLILSTGCKPTEETVEEEVVPATPIGCTTNARTLEGDTGTTFHLSCGACTASSIWGTGTYSDDSSICTAAAHAGVIELGTGGSFTVTIQPGLSDYPSTEQNGITSSHWGTWNRSFTVAE